jgi:hypothetical protein
MFELLDDNDAGTLGHDEAVPVSVERTRREMRCLVEASRQRSRRGESSEPPQIATSASPDLIRRALSPIACTPAAQAVTGAPMGPAALNIDGSTYAHEILTTSELVRAIKASLASAAA